MNKVRARFNLGKFKSVGEMPEQCPQCGSTKIRPDNQKEGMGYCLECRRSFRVPNLKKIPFPVFPKTRKIALAAGAPSYPFGWVRLCAEKPESPTPEDRRAFVPPAYKPQGPRGEDTFIPPPPPLPKPKVTKPQPAIRVNEKLRAEVISVEGNTYLVRLLQKDEGRELRFTRAFIPVQPGNLIEVQVKATDAAGNQVTRVDFSKKIK